MDLAQPRQSAVGLRCTNQSPSVPSAHHDRNPELAGEDRYSAGLNQSEEPPFGDDGGDGRGDKLHAWLADPKENWVEVDL